MNSALRLVEAIKKGATPENAAKHRVRQGQAEEKARLLAKTGGLCEGCSVALASPDMLHVHHVIPVQRGGTNDRMNLTLICPNCHATSHHYDRVLPVNERPEGRRELHVLLRGGIPALERIRVVIAERKASA